LKGNRIQSTSMAAGQGKDPFSDAVHRTRRLLDHWKFTIGSPAPGNAGPRAGFAQLASSSRFEFGTATSFCHRKEADRSDPQRSKLAPHFGIKRLSGTPRK